MVLKDPYSHLMWFGVAIGTLYDALPRCDERVPRTGEKIQWIKHGVLFLGVRANVPVLS